MTASDRPNIVFVFGDQWRAQATGYAGDPNVRTPHLDRFAQRSLRFDNAISNCPVCSPWRATLMTGQYPLTHGVFVNDVPVRGNPATLGGCFRDAGYATGYIGKWHIDGHGRSTYIPAGRRKGFDAWLANECTHDYNHSLYYADDPTPRYWDGYDAAAQTRAACEYVRTHAPGGPFMLMLSWGPPHDPYQTAPEPFRKLYDPAKLKLRPNVPVDLQEETRGKLAGYYAHCSALDQCFGELEQAIEHSGIADNTILVFTADHGDMLGSHGAWNKQRPYEESINVPMLVRWPRGLGNHARRIEAPINAPDLMPTLLGLAGLPVPATVEGKDFAPFLRGKAPAPDHAALIELPACFHQYAYYSGGRDWRGLRTARHTYVRDLEGPWMLFDNRADPYQLHNLVSDEGHRALRDQLDGDLRKRLAARRDAFKPGQELIREAGYTTDQRGDPVYVP